MYFSCFDISYCFHTLDNINLVSIYDIPPKVRLEKSRTSYCFTSELLRKCKKDQAYDMF